MKWLSMPQSSLGIVFILLVWQGLSYVGYINPLMLPSPVAVFAAIAQGAVTGVLFVDLWASVLRVLIGFLVSCTSGILLGVITGYYRWFDRYLDPVVETLRPIPAIAWIPLSILWFGLTDYAAYYIVFYGSFFPVFVTTRSAIKTTGRQYVNAALTLGGTRWQLFWEILIPGALPQMLTGVRLGLGIAWTCVVASELVSAQSGIGYRMQLSRQLLLTEQVIAGMLTLGVLGFLTNAALMRLQRVLMPWGHGVWLEGTQT